ncbi:uncharacterized protein SPSK_04612 [Sporothrix schenckii 1099-18]|uniref:Uncharacterized protein n=1 Tax=Sporothrix schenckii 1099-18 TaxID=1397361 RepID=A0A0F2M494_SPOSC|nr:uncharacterized protein SPSK_04612 [Sporothrix schenckii 1099-18]KJR83630.1 hypothetical protein SPSK_04612 [Sporothrix schenckii 1099-18]
MDGFLTSTLSAAAAAEDNDPALLRIAKAFETIAAAQVTKAAAQRWRHRTSPATQSTEPHRQASNEGEEDPSNSAERGTSVPSEDASQSQPVQVTSTGGSGESSGPTALVEPEELRRSKRVAQKTNQSQ